VGCRLRRKIAIAVGCLVGVAVAGATGAQLWRWDRRNVRDRYEQTLQVRPAAPGALAEQLRLDTRMLADVHIEVDRIEAEMRRMNEQFLVAANKNVGLYTVEQEEAIADTFSRYLVLRRALFHVMFRHMDYAKVVDVEQQDRSFMLAYAAGLSLYRNAVIFVSVFKDQPNARRKLNEANQRLGVPAGMFEEMFANITSSQNVQLLKNSMQEYAQRRPRLLQLPGLQADGLDRLLARLDGYEQQLAEAYAKLSEGRGDVLWTMLKANVQETAYETQTFVSMMVAHVRVPLQGLGFTPETVRQSIQPKLKPGDILLTRRDGYLSNTFLPGFWGHAALYVGRPDEIRGLGADPALEAALARLQGNDRDGFPFAAVEAIGEGVRLSSAEFALHANSLAVLRPKLSNEQIRTAIVRAIELRGVPYDFSFDFSSQDKIICTELVYRAYAPSLDVPFEEVMGRKTLKPDAMLKELFLSSAEPRAEVVLYGVAEDGKLALRNIDELRATTP
jgi:hypothetical protein